MELEELPILGASASIFDITTFDSWCTAIQVAVQEAGPHMNLWWKWTVEVAGKCIQPNNQLTDKHT